MAILKWAVRVHKWVALIVGVQIMLWIAGGLVMSAIPIEQVRGEHKVTTSTPLAVAPAELLSLEAAARHAGVSSIAEAALGQMLDHPVWRLTSASGDRHVIDAISGAVLSPVDESLARRIAIADYSGPARLASIEQLRDPPPEYGGAGPVWQVRFNDRDTTTLYIAPDTALVRARRSSTWRFYDFFWKLHIMDYDDGADFNHPLLISAAGAAIFVALSGLVLLVFRMRRVLTAWQTRRRKI